MKTAIVTGGGSGIGRAVAERYAKKGWRVIVTDINSDTGGRVVDEILRHGGHAAFRQVDSSSATDWMALADWVCNEYGVPDLVVNNAGILIGGSFLEQTGDDWRRMIQVNMMGPILGSRTFVERMLRAGKPGHIVNIASCGAFLPTPVAPSYVTAKAGAYFASQALRAEFGAQGIRVTAICPGLIRTELASNGHRAGEGQGEEFSVKLGAAQRLAWRPPTRVAAAVERSVTWNLATVPVGLEAWLIWFAYRLSPGFVRAVNARIRMSAIDRLADLGHKIVTGGLR